MKKILPIIATLLIHSVICFADTIRVPADHPTIQAGIDAAANGDLVLVAPDTYVENIDFLGKEIELRSEAGPSFTIIDGNQAGNVVTCQTNEMPTTILRGFTITNGMDENNYHSGGMYNYWSSPTVILCRFYANGDGFGFGGGMYNEHSSPTVRHCKFIYNSSTAIHHKIGSLTVENCFFFGNDIAISTMICDLKVSHCEFIDTWRGIHADDSFVKVTHSLFSHNKGCGIEMCKKTLDVAYCTFIKNSEQGGYGGGIDFWISDGTVSDCLFVENKALHGGAISDFGHAEVFRCTFYKNKSLNGGAAVLDCKTVKNCIIWGNEPEQVSSTDVTYSCIQGGYPGTGNIDADPLFVDPDNYDFHLTFPSPCRDSGGIITKEARLDFEGDPRIAYGTIDMGADEFYPHLYYTGDATPGQGIDLKVIGMPQQPALVFLSSDILSNPNQTKYGWWHLVPPFETLHLGQVPWCGYIELQQRIPPGFPVPSDLPLQALVRKLTNLEVIEVK